MSRKDRQKSKLLSATDVLQGLFENGKSALSSRFMVWKLAQRWKEVVGPTIAEHSEPDGYYKGLLYIRVRHSVWMQQLQFMKAEIIANVNRDMRYEWATDIKFRLNHSDAQWFLQKKKGQSFGRSNASPNGDEDPRRGR